MAPSDCMDALGDRRRRRRQLLSNAARLPTAFSASSTAPSGVESAVEPAGEGQALPFVPGGASDLSPELLRWDLKPQPELLSICGVAAVGLLLAMCVTIG